MLDLPYDLSPLPGPRRDLPYVYYPPAGPKLELEYTVPTGEGTLDLPLYEQDD